MDRIVVAAVWAASCSNGGGLWREDGTAQRSVFILCLARARLIVIPTYNLWRLGCHWCLGARDVLIYSFSIIYAGVGHCNNKQPPRELKKDI